MVFFFFFKTGSSLGINEGMPACSPSSPFFSSPPLPNGDHSFIIFELAIRSVVSCDACIHHQTAETSNKNRNRRYSHSVSRRNPV
jgi:hypothetical protein